MKSNYVGVFGLVLLALVGSSLAIPLVEKDFFWFETEDGQVVPAFLNERPNPNLVKNVEDEVFFWHYLNGETEGRQIGPDCTGTCLSGLTRGLPLVVAAHGFGSSYTGGLGSNLKEGFKSRGLEVNLVLIDWSKPAASPDYGSAVKNVKPVGEYVATLVNHLVREGIATLDNTYFAGHSLGAHMSNYIAHNLDNGGKLKTIFALDPAWPLFERRDDNERLDPTDAHFVNVIHTSIGYLGFEEPRGHADFYPNGGRQQPGCSVDLIGSCSHSRAYALLGESIGRPGAFPSCKCTDWKEFQDGRCTCEDQVLMGWDTPATTQGAFFLATRGESPYGQGDV